MTLEVTLHVAIDAVGNKQAGVKTILLDTLAAAVATQDIDRISVFASPASARDFDLPVSDKIEEFPQASAENLALRLLWYERGLPTAVERLQPDVLLCMHSMGQSARSIPHATFVQRPLAYSEETRRLVKFRQRYRMPVIRAAIRRSCVSAERVFVHTPTEKRSIAREFGIGEDRIQIVLPPPRPLRRASDPAPELRGMHDVAEDRRLLFVGQLFAHKNVDAVVGAMPELRQRFPDLSLFIVGPPTHHVQLGPGVMYLGAIPDSALREAYETATLLIMPSLHETIGLPMIEAMSAGTPVLAADLPYAHDVCEDAAMFFDPLSRSDLLMRVSQLLCNPTLRSDLAVRGEHLVERRSRERPYERLVESIIAIARSVGTRHL